MHSWNISDYNGLHLVYLVVENKETESEYISEVLPRHQWCF